ncbi:MAG: KTSC domain-containing protein [Candidatus Harrisonbacteria bacterium]|nr:KTSC domain-containing protein [Candidatus Harrisonbacteria bacterium]
MNREPIQSSDIKSIGYDPETRILEVEFHSGRIYQYANIGENVHHELMKSDSKGSYFNTHIRDQYQNTKVR